MSAMSNVVTAACTAVYVLGAVATFSAGNRAFECAYPNELNTKFAITTEAILWPAFTIVLGAVTTLAGRTGIYSCADPWDRSDRGKQE